MGVFGLKLKSKQTDQEKSELEHRLRDVEWQYNQLLHNDDRRRTNPGRKEFNRLSIERRSLYVKVHGCLPKREEPKFQLGISGSDQVKLRGA